MPEGVPKTIGDALQQRWRVIAGAVVIGVVGALALSVALPKSYESQAILYVDPQQEAAFQSSDGLLSRFVLQRVSSHRVLERARHAVPSQDEQLISDRTVRGVPIKGTNTIGVVAQAASPQMATLLADAVARAVIEQNEEDSSPRLAQSIRYLTDKLAQVRDSIAKGQRAGEGPDALSTLRSEELTTYNDLERLILVRTREKDSISVLEPASAATSVGPHRSTYLLAGLLAGLLMGSLTALLLARFDDRLFKVSDLRAATQAPIALQLGQVDSSSRGSSSAKQRYELVVAQLLASQPLARTFLMVSASLPDHSSEVAAALATAAHSLGRRVRLLSSSPVIDSGVLDGEGVSTLKGQTTQQIQGSLANRAQDDLVFVAVPPPSASSAAFSLIKYCDAAAVVATTRSTGAAQAGETADQIRSAGGVLVAAFLVAR